MPTVSNIASLVAVFVVSAVAGVTVFPSNPKPFMTVHTMEVVDGRVLVERTVREPRRVADWRVTVVSEDETAPSCQTVPGVQLHQGWSDYDTGTIKRDFSIDLWVGDPGCEARLTPGDYTMFVTWTPRDNTPPVTAKTYFSYP